MPFNKYSTVSEFKERSYNWPKLVGVSSVETEVPEVPVFAHPRRKTF